MFKVVDILTFNDKVNAMNQTFSSDQCVESDEPMVLSQAVEKVLNTYAEDGYVFIQMTNRHVIFRKESSAKLVLC